MDLDGCRCVRLFLRSEEVAIKVGRGSDNFLLSIPHMDQHPQSYDRV